MEKRIKNMIIIATILLVVPMSMSYATNINFIARNENSIDVSSNQLTLEDAEVMVMMNTRGELLDSYVISDLENKEAFLVKIREDNLTKLYMVSNEGEMMLVEVF